MKVDINRIKYFLTVGLFLKREHSSKRKDIAIRELQKFYLAVKFFFRYCEWFWLWTIPRKTVS